MSLDSVLTQAAASVPECLAAGYVDAASGMLLSIRTVDSHPREVIDLVAAATERRDQEAADDGGEEARRRGRAAGDGDRHGEGQGDDGDRQSCERVGPQSGWAVALPQHGEELGSEGSMRSRVAAKACPWLVHVLFPRCDSASSTALRHATRAGR